jgi:hypothetical protein
MTSIDVKTLVDVTELKEDYPDFRSIALCETTKIELDMEVLLQSNGEYFRVKVEEIDGDQMVGKVLRENFDFNQPFEFLDWINFERRNVIDIYINYGLIF